MSDHDGSDDSRPDVLSKADEFIKRRRAQLGGAVMDGPLQTGLVDDIPLLTEIVCETGFSAVLPEPELPPHKDLSSDIARELDIWLDENLPLAVVHVMDGITDKLIQQIHASAREELLPHLKRALREDVDDEGN
ncbi:MAG: hypothetical protein WAO76_16980 [Georgfuchsia sp.]